MNALVFHFCSQRLLGTKLVQLDSNICSVLYLKDIVSKVLTLETGQCLSSSVISETAKDLMNKPKNQIENATDAIDKYCNVNV
jgi:hypothetical protein